LLYARRKGWPLEGVEVDVRHERVDGRDRVELSLAFGRDVEPDRVEPLRAVSGRCPVHRMLTRGVELLER